MKVLVSAVALTSLLLTSAQVAASGPLGHVVMAKRTVEGIVSGKIKAPAELQAILKNPEAVRAYCGGAIGPDLDDSAHYNKTSEIPTRMLAAARADLAKARKSGKADQLKAAQEELAFAYGWLNHAASDLNVHPVINALVGDTYRYNGNAGKLLHAELEAEFTAFLAHGQSLPAYDVKVPIEFVARTAFSSKSTLESGIKRLNLKAGAERQYSETRGASPKLKGAFRLVETSAAADNSMFLRNPSSMQNWDLDSGKITSAEFDSLREATMQANGGKLPSNWGSMYMSWNERTNGLALDKKVKIMAGILAGAATPPRSDPTKPTTDPNSIPKGGAWILEKSEFSLQYPDSQMNPSWQPKETGSSGMGTAEARFGHPDPNIFVTVRIKVAWTVPEPKLIPGKTYSFRFAIFDAGSDDNRGLFVGGNGSLGVNCPAIGEVWYGPTAGIALNEKRYKGESTKEYAFKSAPDGSIMVVAASWTVGIRGAYYTYVYKFKAK